MLAPNLHHPGDELQGTWSREQLVQMDNSFVIAVEAAFASGCESFASARATFWSEEAIEAAIEGAWCFSCDQDFDLPFAAVIAFVRARCPSITAERVRFGFERRFRGAPRDEFEDCA